MSRPTSRKTVVGCSILLLFGLLAAGCSEDRPIVTPTEPAGDPTLLDVDATVVEVPNGTQLDQCRVFAGKDSFAVAADGKVNLKVSKKAGQVVLFGDASGKLVHVTLFPADSSKALEINSKETATALVLMNPFLSTNKKQLMDQARSLVQSNTKFPALEATLRSKILGGYHLGDDDPDVKLALGNVYKDLFHTLGQSFLELKGIDPPMVNGLTVQTVSIDATNWTFRLNNSYKRWVRVYGKTHSTAGFSELQSLGLVSSPIASVLEIVLSGGTTPAAQSPIFTLPVGTNDFAVLGCYGLGAGATLSNDEMDRLLQPIIVSTVLDFGFPMVSALSGEALSSFTLTGAIENHPAYPLVNLMLQSSPTLHDDLLAAIRAQDTPKAFDLLSDAFLHTLADNPEPWATSVNGILERTPNAKLVVPHAIKAFVGPVKLMREGLQSSDLTWRFLGGMTADAVTTFRYDYQTVPDFPVRLQGRVQNAAGNVALAGAGVVIVDDHQVPIASLLTDAQGRIEAKVPHDTLDVTITRSGFFSATQRVIIPADVTTYQLTTTLLATVSDTTGTVGGKVSDAANGQGLFGVTVKLVRGLDPNSTEYLGEVTTDEAGLYQFTGLHPGSYTAIATKPGYLSGWLNLTAVGGVTRNDFDLILTTPLGAGFRFVLSWGETPSDLDSHLATPTIEGNTYHVFYNSKGTLTQAPYAQLDVDDTSSYGPETVTIGQAFDGAYRYAIYNYSGSPDITQSGARVILYNGNSILRQWAVPSEGTGRWWYVCDLDAAHATVTEVDSLQVEPPAGMTPSKGLEKKGH